VTAGALDPAVDGSGRRGAGSARAPRPGTFTGPVLFPRDDGFADEIAGYQSGWRHRPEMVVGAADAGDVAAAVEFAATHGLPVGVQATGHGLSVPLPGGVLISTRRLGEVSIDPASRTARLAAGVRWSQVVAEASRHGLAPLNGSAPTVGAVSYTLGGGIGLMARQYGFAADHVRQVEVVTADGRLRRVSAEREPDLFWALRGGRANFGVVTAIEVGLMPVRQIYGGSIVLDGALAADFLPAYRAWTRTLPDELTSSMALQVLPDVPGVPEPERGRLLVHVRLAYTGPALAGRRLVAPLREVGPLVASSLREMRYADCAAIYNDPPRPHPYYGSNVMLRDLDDAALRIMLDLASTGESVIVEVRHLGGALGRPAAAANAVGLRASRYVLRLLTPLGGVALDQVRPAHRRFRDSLAPWAVGCSLNFMYGDDLSADEVRSGYDAGDYARLAELKAGYDPANLFRWHHNIPPATATVSKGAA
jgi:FAD/FMN-containing dehydrogenase